MDIRFGSLSGWVQRITAVISLKTALLLLLLVYRLVPLLQHIKLGYDIGMECRNRGLIPMPDDIIEEAKAHHDPIFYAWCGWKLPVFRQPIAVLIDEELFRITPWLWPFWLPAYHASRLRSVKRILDRRYRR